MTLALTVVDPLTYTSSSTQHDAQLAADELVRSVHHHGHRIALQLNRAGTPILASVSQTGHVARIVPSTLIIIRGE